MTIRGTTHYVEVAGEGSGNVRVTRQYIELLVPASTTHNESVTSNLNFVQQVNLIRTANASSTLNFTQTVSTLPTQNANNVLSLIDSGDFIHLLLDRKPAENTLNFIQSVFLSSNPQVTQNLNFSDTVTFVGPRPVSIYQPINFNHVAKNTAHNLRITDTLEFTDLARVPIPITVNQAINFTDVATITNPVHILNFSQSVTYGKSIGVEVSHLELTDNVIFHGVWTRAISQDSEIGHAMTYFLDSVCAKKSFNPFIGEDTVNSKIQDENPPKTQIDFANRKFLMYYPGTGERTSTVELRAPELDNRDRLAFTRVNQETRGGYLIVFSDPNWPKITTLIFTFVALKKSEIDEIQTFFENYLGLEVGITDWEGREWLGIITDPDQPASEDGRGQWTISFTLEGARLEEEPDQLTLVDLLNFNMTRVRSLDNTLTFTQNLVHVVVPP